MTDDQPDPDVCTDCGHPWIFHVDDGGPCLGHCDCKGFEAP